MNQSLEPLSPESADLVRSGAELYEPPAGVEERLFSRLASALPPVLPAPAPAVPAAPSALGRFGAPLSLVTLTVGLVAGALLHSGLSEPRVEVRTVTVEVPAPAPPPPPAVVAPAPEVPRKTAPAAVAKAPPRVEAAVPDLDLARERQFIEQARSALVRGESRAATEALAAHATSFPGGRLAEERESLWIQALVRLGDFAAARERATAFKARFPNSLLLPAVEAALATTPQ